MLDFALKYVKYPLFIIIDHITPSQTAQKFYSTLHDAPLLWLVVPSDFHFPCATDMLKAVQLSSALRSFID
jgi:hypothetical protein